MAAIVGKAAAPVAKKFMNDEVRKYAGAGSDPYYEYRVVDGKMKKVKKAIPDFIPEHDARILAKAQKRAHRLDKCWSFCGIRFGISSLWGLLPEVGDIIDIFMAIRLAMHCNKIKGGLPLSSRAWIYFVIAIDFLAGLVPIVGDWIDTVMIKANLCTVATLERHLNKIHDPHSSYNRRRREQGLPAPPLPEKQVPPVAASPAHQQPQLRPLMPPRVYTASSAGGTPVTPPPPPPPGAFNSHKVPVRFAPQQQQTRFGRFAQPAGQIAGAAVQGARAARMQSAERRGREARPAMAMI